MKRNIIGQFIKTRPEYFICLTCKKIFKNKSHGIPKYCSLQCRVNGPWKDKIKIAKAKQDKIKSPAFKGNRVGYHGLHKWIQSKKGKASICIKCNSTLNVQWANKSWQYKRDPEDWVELCYRCHRKYDKQNWGVASRKFLSL